MFLPRVDVRPERDRSLTTFPKRMSKSSAVLPIILYTGLARHDFTENRKIGSQHQVAIRQCQSLRSPEAAPDDRQRNPHRDRFDSSERIWSDGSSIQLADIYRLVPSGPNTYRSCPRCTSKPSLWNYVRPNRFPLCIHDRSVTCCPVFRTVCQRSNYHLRPSCFHIHIYAVVMGGPCGSPCHRLHLFLPALEGSNG